MVDRKGVTIMKCSHSFRRALISAAVVVACSGAMAGAAPRPFASVGISPDASPRSFTPDVLTLKDVDYVGTEQLDFNAAIAESRARHDQGLPLRFAIPVRVNYSPENAGTWEPLKNDLVMWRLRVGSPAALTLNLGFNEFRLPEGASLTVLSADGEEVIRPFTSADNQPHGQLWTPILNSDEVILELVVPEKRVADVRLRLGQISAGFVRFGDSAAAAERGTSGSCNVDVACPEGDPWRDEIAAAGAYTVGGIDTCSGSMINNTAQDRRPFFLTAFHCGVDAADAPSVVIFWNFQNSYCRVPGSGDSGGAGDGSLAQFSTGTTFRAGASVSDFTLLEVNTAPNPAWGVTFAGWSREGTNPPSGACIHHPRVAEKRITFYDIAIRPTRPTHGSSWPCSSFPGPGDNSHITAYWSLGVTEPGSSGSPLYDDNQRIIGQLHGGPSSCSQSGDGLSDCYGRVSRSWTGNGTSSTRLSDWLDPLNTGAMVLDTLGRGMDVSPANDTTHLGLVGGPFSPASVDYALNNSTPNPVNYSVEILAGGTAPILLEGGAGPIFGTLSASSSVFVNVSLDPSAASLAAGIYTTQVRFEDLTNGVSYTRTHTIDAGTTGFTVTPATGLSAGGPVGGPFSGSQVYTITSTKPTPVQVTVSGAASWIAVDGSSMAMFTLNGTGDSRNVVVGYSADANALAAGIYNSTVTIDNDSGGDGSTSRPVSLDVGRYTFTFGGPPIPIPDNNPAWTTSVLNVPDAFCVGDVDVSINIPHTFIGDLIAELVSPSGVVVRLHNRTGGSADNLVRDYDQGVVNPDGPGALTDFNGLPAQGPWTLRVADVAGSDLGSITAWSLRIAQSTVACPPVASSFSLNVPDTVTSPVNMAGLSTVGDPLTYTIQSLPMNGSLRDPNGNVLINTVPYTILSGNTVNYRPNALYVGPDSFTYTVADSVPSSPATVSISIGVPEPVVTWDMDTNPGWTLGPGWAYGMPQGLSGDPASGFTGANVVGYNLAGDYTNSLARTEAITPTIDLTGRIDTTISFRRWLGVESSTFDQAGLQVSNDGLNWTTVWAHAGATLNESAWSLQTYDVSAVADNQPAVRFRWYLGPTDGSVVLHGWNIDDVVISAVSPPIAPPQCFGDADDDLDVDFSDITTVLANFGNNYLPSPGTGLGDADDDGDVDFTDITTILAQFGNTCS